MALYKRGRVYWASFTDPGGRRIQRSTGTVDRTEAAELHDKWKAEAWRIAKLGEKPRRRWQEAAVRWLRETSHKAGHEEDKRSLKWLDQHLRGKHLDEITRDTVEQITQARLQTGVSNATVNRTLAVLRAITRRAALDWEWVERAPRVRMLPEPRGRLRWLTREEADKLLAALPAHLADMARFSLATGLRMRNVTHLEWTQVDLEQRMAWIHPDQAKARRAIAVPLNADAVLVLRRQKGKHSRYVFSYRGHAPIRNPNGQPFRDAVKRMGLADVRWHTLRHTWASWHAQQGTPLHVLQELGGWETAAMVRRYSHLAPAHLAEYAERLSRPRVVAGDSFATSTEAAKEGAAVSA